MSYDAPINDMLFVMNDLAGLQAINVLPGCDDATQETVEAILGEKAKFCQEVIAPLNQFGDKKPSTWHDGTVVTSPGFKQAFKQFAQGGWQGVQQPVEFGGQGLPKLVATPCTEMLSSANLSFALCPLLTDGAIEALITAGSPEQQELFFPRLISGEWTGTMNLTEPQAGSDLSQVRTRAIPQEDGTYRLFGTKIFITYGEHDMASNIIHLVLARVPGAPDGVKGISLFIVPKFLVQPDGAVGARNDIKCVSIEHKLGIKASPTAVLQFGDDSGAIGTLVGEENKGLEYMFIMMNAARFAVGIQGLALSERAYQSAAKFAKERIQSRDASGSSEPAPIIRHPDVRRMLMSMRAQNEASRALIYYAAGISDIAHHAVDLAQKEQSQALYEYLVPIVKGWSTELANDVTSTCIQIHGGMGFIEETGVAQYYRDARILAIYEGTTAIQANDLAGRKTARDGGKVAALVRDQIRITASELENHADLRDLGKRLHAACDSLQEVTSFVVDNFKMDIRKVLASSVAYLQLSGILPGAWQMGRAALIAQSRLARSEGDAPFLRKKLATTHFYFAHILPQALTLQLIAVEGPESILALDDSSF